MFKYEETMRYMFERCAKAESIVIFGAQLSGETVLRYLRAQDLKPDCFCDNNPELQGTLIQGIPVLLPGEAAGRYTNGVYIIASYNYWREIEKQLKEYGIRQENIIRYFCDKSYEYHMNLEEEYYEEEIQDIYFRTFGRYLDLKEPKTYNEHVNWEKIYDRNPLRTQLSDKILVRDWVADKIGAKYLNRVYGVWDCAEDIDFASLPVKFALKLNHGSGWNILVRDKGGVNERQIKNQLNEWKKLNYAYYGFEMQYQHIKPRIYCEEFLQNTEDDLYDYKVFCFHGEPVYIMFLSGRGTQLKMTFYDTNWNKQPFVYSHPMYEGNVPCPAKLDEMLELSRKLSRNFKHVRIDWYYLPGDVIRFGEMTFTSLAGLAKWEPEEYNRILGELI